jgi:hypothetical protein
VAIVKGCLQAYFAVVALPAEPFVTISPGPVVELEPENASPESDQAPGRSYTFFVPETGPSAIDQAMVDE